MPTFDELANDPQARYEYLLRVIRYWLARKMSFTEIEEALVAVGIAPKPAEQIVELVIQDLQGRVRAPGEFPDVDVPLAAIEALGFDARARPAWSEEPTDDAAPAMEFADPAHATRAADSRARGASRTFTVGALVFVVILVGFGLLLLTFGW